MMKSIIIVTILILFNCCNAQRINTENNDMKYYSKNQYKDWDFDTIHCDPKYNKKCSRDDDNVYLMKVNDRVEISKYNEVISIEKSSVINPYIFLIIYDSKTKLITANYEYFCSSAIDPIGVSKEYDKNGNLIKEKNWDKPYKFSMEDMIKKFKQEYNVDIENRKNIYRFYRYEKMKEVTIPYYKIYLKTEVENKWVEYLIDGNTGKTLYTLKISEGDETDLVEEYLKSIGKFKGTPSKSDPATSKRLTPLPNEELGKSYAYGGAVPQNTHQIYEGKAYTKTEWETFQKSLPWWKKIL